MIARRTFFALAIFTLAASSTTAAWSATTGEWTAARQSDAPATLQVDFKSDDASAAGGHWNSSFDIAASRFGLGGDDLDSAGKHVQFTFAREAGSFACEGWAGHGRGAGSYTFSANPAFLAGLRQRGFGELSDHKQEAAATLDITLGYIDAIASAGFVHIPFDKLIAFRALGVTGASIAQLQAALGGTALTENQVTSLAALGVTPTYISDMRSLGISDLNAHRAVELKALGIDRTYADGLAKAGYPHLSANDLVQMKALGIDEAYLRKLASHGLHNLTVSQLVQMKAVGI